MKKGPLSKRDLAILIMLVVAVAGVAVYRYWLREQQTATPLDLGGLPGVVAFSSSTCYYCVEQKKVFDELAPEYTGRAKFIRLDVYEYLELFQQLGGRYIPSLLFLNADGDAVAFQEGFHSSDLIVKWLESQGVKR